MISYYYVPELKCCKDVEVKNSPKHGKGVFTTKRIKKGQCVGFYDGMMFEFENGERDAPYIYLMLGCCFNNADFLQNTLDPNFVIGGFPVPNRSRYGIATYINTGYASAIPDVNKQMFLNNCYREIYWVDGKMGYKYITTRNIDKGEELLIDYGSIYWTKQTPELEETRLNIQDTLREKFMFDDNIELNINKWKENYDYMKNYIKTLDF